MNDRLKNFEDTQRKIKEQLKGDLEKSSSGGDYKKVNFFYIKTPGTYKFRIVPYRPEYMIMKHYGNSFGVIHPKTGKGGIWSCSMDEHGTCPFCEEYNRGIELEKASGKKGNTWKKKVTRAFWYLAIDHEGKPGILQMEWNCFKAWDNFKDNLKKNKDYEDAKFEDFENGRAVTITTSKNGNYTNFDFLPSPNITPVTVGDCDKLFDDFPEYSVLNRKFTPDELKMILDNDFSFMEYDKADETDTKKEEKPNTDKEASEPTKQEYGSEKSRLEALDKELRS